MSHISINFHLITHYMTIMFPIRSSSLLHSNILSQCHYILHSNKFLVKQQGKPCSFSLMDLPRKTLYVVYKEPSVVCKWKYLFLKQGFPWPTSACTCSQVAIEPLLFKWIPAFCHKRRISFLSRIEYLLFTEWKGISRKSWNCYQAELNCWITE